MALGQVFFEYFRFPLPILIPPTAPHTFSIWGWYSRGPSGGRRTKWAQSHPTAPRGLKGNTGDNSCLSTLLQGSLRTCRSARNAQTQWSENLYSVPFFLIPLFVAPILSRLYQNNKFALVSSRHPSAPTSGFISYRNSRTNSSGASDTSQRAGGGGDEKGKKDKLRNMAKWGVF
jgi:hypothetical protein